jgi:hypothetical protein
VAVEMNNRLDKDVLGREQTRQMSVSSVADYWGVISRQFECSETQSEGLLNRGRGGRRLVG